MEQLPHSHLLRADPPENSDRDSFPVEQDPWGFTEFRPETETPVSTNEIRELFLKSKDRGTAAPAATVSRAAYWQAMAGRVRAGVVSRLPRDRRIIAGLGALAAGTVLLFGLSRLNLTSSIGTVSGATYDTAVATLASAVETARELAGKGPEPEVTTAEVGPVEAKPTVRASGGKRGPIEISQPLPVMPLVSGDTVHANAPALIDDAVLDAALDTTTTVVAAPVDAVVTPVNAESDSSIVYSPTDTDVSPPVGIRAPGIATEDTDQDRAVSLIEILVNETGRVEFARGRQRPATLGAALQSATALSVVKTWRFRPARLNGRPVKYRTVVPFIETPSVARHD